VDSEMALSARRAVLDIVRKMVQWMIKEVLLKPLEIADFIRAMLFLAKTRIKISVKRFFGRLAFIISPSLELVFVAIIYAWAWVVWYILNLSIHH